MRRIGVVAIVVVAALLAGGGIATAQGGIAQTIIGRLASSFGYNVTFAGSHIGISRSQLTDVRVTNKAGEPVLTAAKIDVGYSLMALVRGTRRYGLEYVDVVDPHVTVVHHQNGTYNVQPLKMGGGAKKKHAPLDLRLNVTGGSVMLVDQYSAPPKQLREQIVGLEVHGAISPKVRSGYTARMALDVNGHRYPIEGTGTFDAPRGFDSQRWTAGTIPIASLVNFGLPTHEIHVARGDLRNVDIRFFSLADNDGTMQSHLGGHATLASVDVTASRLRKPLRDLHGDLLFTDGAVAMPQMRAELGSIPITVAGGIYDFSSPSLHMGARLSASLQQLQTLAATSTKQPVRGQLTARALIVGPAKAPLIFAAFASPHIQYGSFAVSRAGGLVAVQGSEIDVVDTSLQYSGMRVTARGHVALQQQPAVTLVASVNGSSDGLPYASQIVPNMPLRAVALVTGAGRALNVHAVIDGRSRTQQLSGIANVAANGTGTAGPISIDGPGNSRLVASVILDRPDGGSSTIVAAAHDFAIRPGRPMALPGLSMHRLPDVSGVIDAQAVAFTRGKGIEYFGGDVGVSSARFNGMALNRLLAVGQLVRNRVSAVADVSTDASTFRHLGVPIESGTAEAIARVSGKLPTPRADVSALLAGGRIANAPVSGHLELSYDGGNSIALVHSAVSVGGGLAMANGTVSDIRSGSPRYDVNAEMREADLAVLTKTFHVKLPYAEGRIEANAHVHGTGKTPIVAGNVSIPEASINALPFHAQTAFSGDASHIVTHGGKLVVGSTQLSFAADVGKTERAMSISSRALNLADFNDYFPAAETLAGTGSLAVNLVQSPSSLSSQGTIAIANARYRRFPLGSTYARWSTAGRRIAANGFVAGSSGTLKLAGTGQLPAATTPAAIASGTVLDATASVRAFDLGTWLPAAGINAPVLGRIDADATARGRLKTIALNAHASLTNGLVNQVPVQRFTISATASNGRGRLVAGNFDIPYLSATASGTFGLSPKAPIDLTMHATSPDIGALTKTVTHKPAPFGGTLDTTLRATGVPAKLAMTDAITVQHFTHGSFVIPTIHTEVAMKAGSIDVRDGTIAFEKGDATFGAHVPLASRTLGFRSTGVPISGQITADGVDLAQFASLLPKGTNLGGTLAGQMVLSGSDIDPRFDGAVALSNGTYSSPDEKNPLTNGTATLVLDGTHLTIPSAHFNIGKGTIDSRAAAVIADMRDPAHALAFSFVTTLNRAVFNLPKYFNGQLDGTLNVTKSAHSLPSVAGNFTVSHTRIPAAGIVAAALAKPSGKGPPVPIPLNFHVTIGDDVRLQGDGVNVGAAGTLALGGTLAKPVINGSMRSTGGTVSLYRDFTIQTAQVTWNGTGIIPDINATATTFLAQPPTNVRLHATGPATQMNIGLTSNPPYSKGQILALMIGGPSLAGLNGLQTAQGTTPNFVQGVSQGVVNGLFARAITEPLTSGLGSALGLQNVQLNYDIAGQGGFSAQVAKRLGQNLSLQFAQSYGFPSRTSIGLRDELNAKSSVGFTIFSTYGSEGLGYYAPYLSAQPTPGSISLQAEQPAAGEQGFGLHYTRYLGR